MRKFFSTGSSIDNRSCLICVSIVIFFGLSFVIASNIDNHSELINNKESGYLFDFEKPEILNLYNKLRDQKKQLETVSNAAMREVIKKNSLEKISKEIHLDYLRVSKS